MGLKVGDSIPDVELMETKPDDKVSLGKELASGKGLIIGIPGAFSPGCTASHVPGYLNHKSLSSAGKVFVIGVNDPFVMNAWKESLDPDSKSGIRFIADPTGAFIYKSDLHFPSAGLFGQDRAKRFAIKTENGKVTDLQVEPDNTSVNVSAAEKILG